MALGVSGLGVGVKWLVMAAKLWNWAGNLEYGAAGLAVPETLEELQEIVARSARVKALGTRHSFSNLADTQGVQVSTARLNRVLNIDRELRQVWVEGGATYGDLCRTLDAEGFALPNLASLPHISVAGACATATHGSGEGNQCLAGAVAEIEIVRGDGEIVRLGRDDADFFGAVVSLGALGIVARLKMDLIPIFEMSQTVYEGLPLDTALAHFDEIQAMAYSVSFFTRWQDSTIDQVWLKHRGAGDGREEIFGARAAREHRHPIPNASPIHCTSQMGEVGPWFERIPHFKMDFTPSSGEELQSEYLVPLRYAVEALAAVNELAHQISPHLHISEIRTVAADSFWMSPFYEEPGVGIHFTWRKDWEAVSGLLPVIEAKLAPFQARPHWGKLFAMKADAIRPLYPRLSDFGALARKFDPAGKFLNGFLQERLGWFESKSGNFCFHF